MSTNSDNKCRFRLNNEYMIEYLRKIIEEMLQDKIKFKEIIQEDNYYVSDIVDYTQYSNRPDQKIIKTTNFNYPIYWKIIFTIIY